LSMKEITFLPAAAFFLHAVLSFQPLFKMG
jgi:hypothetical protein